MSQGVTLRLGRRFAGFDSQEVDRLSGAQSIRLARTRAVANDEAPAIKRVSESTLEAFLRTAQGAQLECQSDTGGFDFLRPL